MPRIIRVSAIFFGVLLLIALTLSISMAQSEKSSNSLEKSFNRAIELIQAERLDEALMILKNLDANEANVAAKVNTLLGQIYLRIGKPAKALELFEHASLSTMDAAGANLGIAKANLALGKLRRAKSYASRALRSDPDLFGAHLILANVADRSGDVVKARNIFSTLLRDQPNNQFVAKAYGKFMSGRGDTEAAIKFLKRFVAANPNSAEVADLLGLLYWSHNGYRLAYKYRQMAASIFDAKGNVFRSGAIRSWLAANFPDAQIVEKEDGLPEPDKSAADGITVEDEQQTTTIQILSRPDPLPFKQGVALSTGSGFVVYGGRYVITNHHVIEGTKKIAVRSGTGAVRNARVVAVAKSDDLALLELFPPYPSNYSISFKQMSDASPGRGAIVMGFPMAGILGWEKPSLTEGIVSKASGMNDDPNTFLITTKINKGNSGGPILDRSGNLIGVVVAKLNAAIVFEEQGYLPEDVNIGIKSSRVLQFMKQTGGNDVAKKSAPANLEELYQSMLSSVVLVAGEVK